MIVIDCIGDCHCPDSEWINGKHRQDRSSTVFHHKNGEGYTYGAELATFVEVSCFGPMRDTCHKPELVPTNLEQVLEAWERAIEDWCVDGL